MRRDSLVVRNVTKDLVLCFRGFVAETIWKRSAGMMFRRSWGEIDGLLLRPCSSIHTFWMWMPIDVCFVDDRSMVVEAIPRLSPRSVAVGKRGAFATLELPAGTLERTGTGAGDRLSFTHLAERVDEQMDHPRQAC